MVTNCKDFRIRSPSQLKEDDERKIVCCSICGIVSLAGSKVGQTTSQGDNVQTMDFLSETSECPVMDATLSSTRAPTPVRSEPPAPQPGFTISPTVGYSYQPQRSTDIANIIDCLEDYSPPASLARSSNSVAQRPGGHPSLNRTYPRESQPGYSVSPTVGYSCQTHRSTNIEWVISLHPQYPQTTGS
ncbi:hypothetical protein K469DRAFT_699215 [Zopfia rhizophila CBS 207.26]|uniref:Uncharacterized protein n=1 Tax=Zopfia rhizophila CBS 207.26 TaxID=1314779 RepID=A0A6A6EZT4_9PEZI|nr:hypothetical protein K469DRAFT_699215 [Zopfia rhizophila CBS 207.26]